MYHFGAVTRGQMSSLRIGNVVSYRLFDTCHISKNHCQVPTRCHTVRNIYIKGAAIKQGRFQIIFQQNRNYRRAIPIKRTFTPKFETDNVPRDYEIIYQANLGKKHSRAFLILGAVVLGYVIFIGYFALLFTGNWKFDKETVIPGVNISVPTLTLKLSYFIIGFIILWTCLCNSFARLPVQRIYESPCKDKYIGILKKNVFSTERVEFDMSEIIGIPPKRGQILKTGNANIKGRSCLIYAVDFKQPNYFNKLLGYDPGLYTRPRSDHSS